MNKKIVKYTRLYFCKIGEAAFLDTVNHPNLGSAGSTKPAITSNVISFDPETGHLETENTKYVPELAT